jgi:predicted Zn finger-like uncharacterized protein
MSSMVVTCEHCGARYRLDQERIQGRGARITCPRCRHVFVVYQSAEGEVATEAVLDERPTDVHSLDFKSVGIGNWKVKTGIGLVYDFSDFKTLRKYLKEGRVSSSDTLSHDGEQWTEIKAIDDLEVHFIDTYVQARSALKEDAQTEVAAETAAHEAVDAGEIADGILDQLTTSEVDAESGLDIAIEDEEAEEEESSADDIASQLLAAVEAASSDEDDGEGIDLDMDSLLEAASAAVSQEKAPASARRGREDKVVETVAKTGNDDENPHQFVDPFEALKQARQSQGTAPRRRGTKRAAKKAAEVKSKQNRKLILGGLFVTAILAFFFVGTQEAAVVQTQAPSATVQKQKAQEEAIAKRKAEARAEMQAKLNKQLEEVEVEDMEAFTVEEEQLIVRVPEQFRTGAKGKIPAFPQGATGAVPAMPGSRAVTQRAMSLTDHVSAGDAAARSKQWELASSAYEKALEMQPQNGRIRARYGNALFKRGDMGGAEVELRQALSLGAAVAHKYLGHMAREQGDISGANTHYQAYLGSSPPDARAIKLLIETMTP